MAGQDILKENNDYKSYTEQINEQAADELRLHAEVLTYDDDWVLPQDICPKPRLPFGISRKKRLIFRFAALTGVLFALGSFAGVMFTLFR
ncbi:MAG: hypothetical protein ACOX7J_01515 [Bacillota bacterium]|jgi:hypothetical protein